MFFRYNCAGLLWALFIFILCAIPGKSLPEIDWLELLSFDKFVHFCLFAILVYLLIRGFSRQRDFLFIKKHSIISALLFSIPYGGVLELLQTYYFEDRMGDWIDFTANTIGCFSGIWFYSFLRKKEFKLFGIQF